MTQRIPAIFVSFGLIALAIWLVPFNGEQRRLYFRDYTFGAEEAQRLARHPDIIYAHGVQAEGDLDMAAAMDLYQRVTARNPLHIGAWLRQADLSAAAGDLKRAQAITIFCDAYIGPVLRWKWPHTLLAQGLDLADIFSANINFLVARNEKVNDALNLLDTHCQGNPAQALSILTPENQPAYLEWALRWKNTAAAAAAWQALSAGGRADRDMLADYVNYLILQKRINEAAAVWQQANGKAGITNAGFEEGITGKGFDWHAGSDRTGNWEIRQDAGGGYRGGSALQIRFDGRANVAFHHVRQVAAVAPETPYRLTFWWREAGLTTDQVPFLEVSGYDVKGLYQRSQGLQGAPQWQQAQIDFTSPPECRAITIRIRRLASQRFDNKIRGSIWFDEFELTSIPHLTPDS